MQLARPAIAVDPRRFGRAPQREVEMPRSARSAISGDVKLFASTFLAGFLFVSVLIG